ncbi:MAG: 3-oxoacyl-ACP reductase FabG [Candidatus Eremiobacteraeota bacterium]|nr:3-oxoacyl-ACP reductase FabG [Candidatus Eremiobacteraeota bacterium]MBC5826963.1 3-oxoacyl-ACP reductase FabG [Candidatus Eremiobacteraeota bacterium]
MSDAGALQAKRAVITGAGTGIGRSIAIAFGRAGAAVMLCGRRREPLDEVGREVTRAGGTALVHQADVSLQPAAIGLIEAASAQMGGVDLLVNNAGRSYDALVVRMKWDALDDSIAVNLKSVFYLCAAAGKVMLAQKGGAIINVSSVVALTGNAGQSAYVAAKAGVIGLTKSLAQEFGSRGIRVNAIAPGYIETEMTASLPEAVKQTYRSRVPLRRFGAADEVARVAVFLASDAAAYVTGQTLAVDGGLSMQ